jgi:hypothetical protein
MKVKVVYRNYRSLHDLYASFRIEPPQGVTYSIQIRYVGGSEAFLSG